MGSRINTFLGEKAKANLSANRAELKQAQQQYQSKSKFGKTDSRSGGLSQDEIGDAPTMKFSKGLVGDYERTLAGLPEEEKRRGFGGGSSARLG